MTRYAVWLALGVACAGPEVGRMSMPELDVAGFAERVQPHLAAQCTSASCHGRPDRPYSLFASGQHRSDATRTFLDEPLELEELVANARRTAALALTVSPEDSVVVRKPLAVARGGLAHGGGEIYADLDDPGCAALRAWLGGVASRDGGVR